MNEIDLYVVRENIAFVRKERKKKKKKTIIQNKISNIFFIFVFKKMKNI